MIDSEDREGFCDCEPRTFGGWVFWLTTAFSMIVTGWSVILVVVGIAVRNQ